MVMEFEQFAEKFRERTAKRLLEFEGKLEKAQQELEKQADHQARKQPGSQHNQQGRASTEQQPAQPSRQLRQDEANENRSRRYGAGAGERGVGINQLRDVSRAGGTRQVKSVLRRGVK